MATNAQRDENRIPTILAETNDANRTVTPLKVDPTTGRLLVDFVDTGGDVTGPASSTDGAPALWDGTDGKTLKDSTPTGTGNPVLQTSPTLITPDLGTPSAGVATNLSGTAASLTAGTVTTNANLTGPITSVGNTTAIDSQTGTGVKFVVDTSPTLVTPTIGIARATSVTFPLIATPATPVAGDGILYALSAGGVAVPHWRFSTGTDFSVFRDNAMTVLNSTGSTITPGQAVYIVGASGGFPSVALAKADAAVTSIVLGVASVSILSGGVGGVQFTGSLQDIDTSSFSAGDVLWLSDSVAGALTTTAPSNPSIQVNIGVVTVDDPTIGSITLDIQPAISLSLDSLSDVTIASPTVDQFLRYNGTTWVNGNTLAASASPGVFFYNSTPVIISRTSPAGISQNGTAGNGIQINSLSKTPVTTAEQTQSGLATSAGGTRAFAAWLYDTALGRTTIDSGLWSFSTFVAIDGGGGVNTLTRQIYQVQVPAGTVTSTGVGANSRTFTASTGTPFALTGFFSADATNTTASYIKTPLGIFQITARTSDTVITVTVPTGYVNESTVAYTVWNKLFGATSADITATGTNYSLLTFSVAEPAFAIAVTDKLGGISFFSTTAASKTITLTYDGNTRNTHFQTPLITLHNELAGLQGGTGDEFYHLTSTEYTGSGTGVFARVSSPVFTTPNIGSATGSVSGNAGTVTNATLTTALTVDTGTVRLIGNAANNSVLTLGAGGSSISGANTGDNTVATALKSATTDVDVSAATAPSNTQVLTATDSTHATWQTPTAVPVKASAAELDTGTDDAKFATAKAIKDSHNVPSVVPSTSGNVLTSNGTDWTSATPAAAGGADGWISAGTFTYNSANTITVASGAGAIYAVGDRIKWTQTSVRYGVLTAVADTLLTIAVNTDYVVDNAAITLPFYSHQVNPLAYPYWFNYTPTWDGFSVDPSNVVARYAVNGRSCHLFITSGTGTSDATNFTVTAGIANGSGATLNFPFGFAEDNTAGVTSAGRVSLASASTTLTIFKDLYTGTWTGSGAKRAHLAITYQI